MENEIKLPDEAEQLLAEAWKKRALDVEAAVAFMGFRATQVPAISVNHIHEHAMELARLVYHVNEKMGDGTVTPDDFMGMMHAVCELLKVVVHEKEVTELAVVSAARLASDWCYGDLPTKVIADVPLDKVKVIYEEWREFQPQYLVVRRVPSC